MRTRSIITTLALLTSGTLIGVAGQQIATADVSEGGRPVLIQITPCRVADTRPGDGTVGPRSAPLGAGDTHTINVQQAATDCTGKVPADATGVALNVTSIGATQLTFLTIWPGGSRPLASGLNPAPGEPPTPNAVTTALSVDQTFNVYNNLGSVDVVVDVTGYYVNHDHDDRYSTAASGFGQTLQGAEVTSGASVSGSNVAFPDSGVPTTAISFGLPQSRSVADPILVQIPFTGPPNCAFVLSATGVAGPFSDTGRFLNAGWSVVGATDGIVRLGPNPQGSSFATTIVTFSHGSSDDLAGGASVEMRLVRQADDGNDTCASAVIARGGFSVEY
jgi:hypothetical protein